MNLRQKILWAFLVYFLTVLGIGVAFVIWAVAAIANYAAKNPWLFAGN